MLSGPVALAVKTHSTKIPMAGPRTRLGHKSATTPAATGPSTLAATLQNRAVKISVRSERLAKTHPWMSRQKMSE